MVKNKSNNMGLIVTILVAASVVVGGAWFFSTQQTTLQVQETGQCEIAPSIVPLAFDFEDRGTAASGTHSVYQDGIRLTSSASDGTAFSTGLKKGTATILFNANDSESTGGFYPAEEQVNVECGANTFQGFVKDKTALTVSNVINNDGLTSNGGAGSEQAIGDGDSATFEIKLQGSSKDWSGDCGNVVVVDVNTTMLVKEDITLSGLGATEISVPDTHTVGATGESPKAWKINAVEGSALQSIFLTLQDDPDDGVNPSNYSTTVTFYDQQQNFHNANTGLLETGCFVEDENDNDLGLGTVTQEILTT